MYVTIALEKKKKTFLQPVTNFMAKINFFTKEKKLSKNISLQNENLKKTYFQKENFF